MTSISRPTSYDPNQVQRVLIKEQITLQLGSKHYEAKSFDGGETTTITVEEILDAQAQPLQPVWEQDWVEISPGIHTKQDAMKISRSACPVHVTFEQKRYQRFWNRRTYEDEYSLTTTRYQIVYEPG